MAYNHNYKFTRPFTKDGKETKWHQVIRFIKSNGPVSKREIVKAIWGYNGLYKNVRGYQSSMFAQLNEIHPEGVHYDKDLKKWTTYEHKENPIHMSKPVVEDMKTILNAEDIIALLNFVNTNYIKDVEDKIKMLEKSIKKLKKVLSFIANTTE